MGGVAAIITEVGREVDRGAIQGMVVVEETIMVSDVYLFQIFKKMNLLPVLNKKLYN